MPSMTVFEYVLYLGINRKMLAYDRRSEPRVGERVPYVIIYGTPGVPLIQLVRRPVEVLQDPTLRLNATYYINKQILPPLARIFSLIGIDVFNWYHELPRVSLINNVCGMTVERIHLKFPIELNFLFMCCDRQSTHTITLNWQRCHTFMVSQKKVFYKHCPSFCYTDQILK